MHFGLTVEPADRIRFKPRKIPRATRRHAKIARSKTRETRRYVSGDIRQANSLFFVARPRGFLLLEIIPFGDFVVDSYQVSASLT